MTGLITNRHTIPAYLYNKFFEDSWDSLYKAYNMKPKSSLPTDIYEEGNAVYIEMAVSGYSMDDISIEVLENVLTISTETSKILPHETYNELKELKHSGPLQLAGNRKYIQHGLAKRYFSQSYAFKDCLVSDTVASLDNGVLKIKIPKNEAKTKKVINIVNVQS